MMSIDNWAFFDGNGDSITRGWQGTEEQARRQAQAWANERGIAVEFIAESALYAGAAGDDDYKHPQGDVVVPARARKR